MSNCHEYIPDITKAFNCEHTQAALEAYASIRRAIVLPDNMSEGALIALHRRVMKAADKYPSNTGRENAAFNKVLLAYADYLNLVMWERDYAEAE